MKPSGSSDSKKFSTALFTLSIVLLTTGVFNNTIAAAKPPIPPKKKPQAEITPNSIMAPAAAPANAAIKLRCLNGSPMRAAGIAGVVIVI